jgi:predicted phage tail protein
MPSFWGGNRGVSTKTSLNLFSGQSSDLTKDVVYAMTSKIAEWRLLAQKLNKNVAAALLQRCEERMLHALNDQTNTQSPVVSDVSESSSSSKPSFGR